MFTLLNHLEIQSAYQDISILEALDFIKEHQNSRKEWVDAHYYNEKKEKIMLNLSWLPDAWRKLVTGKAK